MVGCVEGGGSEPDLYFYFNPQDPIPIKRILRTPWLTFFYKILVCWKEKSKTRLSNRPEFRAIKIGTGDHCSDIYFIFLCWSLMINFTSPFPLLSRKVIRFMVIFLHGIPCLLISVDSTGSSRNVMYDTLLLTIITRYGTDSLRKRIKRCWSIVVMKCLSMQKGKV